MEGIKILVDLLTQLQASEQYEAATTVGIRLKEEIYKYEQKLVQEELAKQIQPTEKENEVRPVQPQQA